MKWILILAMVAACSTKVKEEKRPEVTKVMSPIQDAAFYDLEGTYSLPHGKNCEITWSITRKKEKVKKNILLRLYQNECKDSFTKLLPTHRAILTKLFADFPADSVVGVSTGGFEAINPTGEWNLDIAKASYNFKSRRSTNSQFVDFAKQTNSYQPFKDLFKGFGINLELDKVEKVFFMKVKETKFKDQFGPSLQNQNVMTDAGMIWWKQ
ncbi:hypothetical protein [Peredibacter starrii]|uniref:Lipoprotein n=1 Tax=Peredibacter starrii TaxID=28202 RepID=A0AAX4HR70_9BACT|nr:hypothetical protein [Peredibacter starrii]WPU65439.1 hypothetical protein SOO65_01630 [Peredibacter starrii]